MKELSFTQKLADLCNEIMDEIETIVLEHGGEIEFTDKCFKFNHKTTLDKNFRDTITKIEISPSSCGNDLMITRTNPEIMFEVECLENELDIYQLIDFLSFLQRLDAEVRCVDIALLELKQYIWNDRDFKQYCTDIELFYIIVNSVIDNVKENFGAYLLDEKNIGISWYETCDGKYTFDVDEVYELFKITVNESK